MGNVLEKAEYRRLIILNPTWVVSWLQWTSFQDSTFSSISDSRCSGAGSRVTFHNWAADNLKVVSFAQAVARSLVLSGLSWATAKAKRTILTRPSSCAASMRHRRDQRLSININHAPLSNRQENVFDFQSITANANKWSDWRIKPQLGYRWANCALDESSSHYLVLINWSSIDNETIWNQIAHPSRFFCQNVYKCQNIDHFTRRKNLSILSDSVFRTLVSCWSLVYHIIVITWLWRNPIVILNCESWIESGSQACNTSQDSSMRRTRYISQSSTTRSSVNLLSKVGCFAVLVFVFVLLSLSLPFLCISVRLHFCITPVWSWPSGSLSLK